MAGYKVLLDIYDIYGNRTRTVNGVSVDGPARGVRNVTFIPQGGILNAQGTLHFEIPLTLLPDLAITPGCTIVLKDNVHTRGEVGMYQVTEKSETVQPDSDVAAFDCPSLDEELRWQTVPAYAANVAAGETVTQTATNLLAIPARYGEPAWTVSVNPALYQYAGVAFAASGVSVATAFTQLANDRFLGWRTQYQPGGATVAARFRAMELGTFGTTKSGIRLTTASRRPNAMTDANVRPIQTYQVKRDAASIVNCLIPIGSGSGIAAVTLRALYNFVGESAHPTIPGWLQSGPVSFAGYNPQYRLYRRRMLNATGYTPTEYEYFLADMVSVAANRQRWQVYPLSSITPVSATPQDNAAAAAALYQATVAHLQWYATQNILIGCVADGRGVIRGIAGNTIDLFINTSSGGVTQRFIRQPMPVLSVTRAVNTETMTAQDTYVLTSNGRMGLTDTSLIVGIQQQIDYFRMVPTVQTSRQTYNDEQYLDAANPITFTIPGDASMIERLSGVLTITLVPIRSTAKTAASTTLSFSVPIPALSVNSFGTPAHVHGGISGGAHAHGGVTSGPSSIVGSALTGTATTGTYDPSPSLLIVSGGSGTTNLLSWNGSNEGYLRSNGATGALGITRTVLAAYQTAHAHTLSGTAAVQSIANYSGFAGIGTDTGTSAQTIGGVTTAATTTATGGVHAHDLVYGIYNGPLPTKVAVAVDSTVVIAAMNNPSDNSLTNPLAAVQQTSVDISAYMQDQQSHTVTISAASIGGVAWAFSGRHRESNVRV